MASVDGHKSLLLSVRVPTCPLQDRQGKPLDLHPQLARRGRVALELPALIEHEGRQYRVRVLAIPLPPDQAEVAEVSNFSTADGGNVQQWSWTGTSSQQWHFVSVGGGYYNVINRNSGKCLDVNGVSTADGAIVQQWMCNGGTNQRWQLVAEGSYYQLKAQHSGKVLDVVGNGTADGVNIDQWTWNGGANQQWQIVP